MNVLKILSTLLIFFMIAGTLSSLYGVNSGENTSKTDSIKVTSASKVIYVANNGTDRNNGITPSKPKRNIQSAIYAANPGDTIRLASGSYVDTPLNIDKNLTICGAYVNNTIIDGRGEVCCLYIIEGVTATITNLTITKGNGYKGGAINNAGTLNLKNIDIINNKATIRGGGIENDGKIIGNGVLIKNNTANWGGGIHNNKEITLTNSTISNNKAEFGGGIYNLLLLTIEDSNITYNTGNNTQAGVGGIDNTGILYLYGSNISFNKGKCCGGLESTYRSYVDDLTIIVNNTPTNTQGWIIPA
jgi:hypothetical protein